MYLPRGPAFLLIAVLVNACTQCRSHYLNHTIDDGLCGQPLKIPSLDVSIVLESSLTFRENCSIEISRPTESDGLVVVVQNVSIVNSIHSECHNYIQFGSSSTGKWCATTDAKSLVITDTPLDIAINLSNASDSYLNLVITPYKKSLSGEGQQGEQCDVSAPFMCRSSTEDQQLCISNAFRCDGRNNCPKGYDEIDCNSTFVSEVYTEETTTEAIAESTIGRSRQTTRTTRSVETTEPYIKSTIYFSDPEYEKYNMIDFCNGTSMQPIELSARGNGTTVPAIVELTADDAQQLNDTECTIRFQVPSGSLVDGKGLIVGIDSLDLATDECDDYLEVSGTNTDLPESVQWCKSKTDLTGVSATGNGDSYLDITFHSTNNTNSSFALVITQYQGKFMRSCPSSKNLKCKGSNNECVSKDFQCDGHRNCPTGTDEEGCGDPTSEPTPTTLSPTTPTISPSTSTTTSTSSTSPPSTTPQTTTPSTNSSTTLAPTSDPHHGMSGGSIALTVVGVLVAVGLIVSALYIVRKRRAGVQYAPLN